ncbi:MAG: PQQ-dependent sugar dehydrogenase [Nannocystales bacterium]
MRLQSSFVALGILAACSSGPGAPGSGDATDAASSGSPTAETGAPGTFVGLSFETVEAEGNWGMITDARFIPGTDELLVLEKSGRVGHLRLEGDRFALLGSFMLEGAYSVLDCGLISLALDPDFDTNGFFYVGMCASEQQSEIHRYTFEASDYGSVPASAALILAVGDPDAPKPWHNVGSIGFEPDGTMWALFGDKKVDANGQDTTNALSALVRLIPNREPTGEGYTVPPGNAFASEDEGHPLVYATGLRSPWKGIRDSAGRFWFGDVGANTFEEVNVITQAGQNFGWSAAEGPCEQGCSDFIDPVLQWPHAGVSTYAAQDPDVVPTNARVAYVALEVQAHDNDPYAGALDGHVLFGDYCQGWVRGAQLDSAGAVVADMHLGHLFVPSAWVRGRDGFIYAATFGKCETPSIDEDDPPASVFVRALPVFEP